MNRRAHCPTCRKQVSTAADNAWRPFCSDRCRLIDLGEWIEGNRRIPAAESTSDATGPQGPDTKH